MSVKKNLLASIVIVSYNEAQYIHQAIDSCLALKGDNIEIIIGDDGSDDGSISIIEEYVQKYPEKIRYFVQDRSDIVDLIPSIRVSNVIKRAISMANGEYILCLSGDDYFCDDMIIEDAAAFLDKHPKHSAYISKFKLLWPDGTELSEPSKYPPVLHWSGLYIHISAFVFRKSVFDQGMFLQRFCDDTGLIYSLVCAGKWGYSDKMTFIYRQREKSIVHEARTVELKMTELMLLQDILCKKKICSNPVKNWLKRNLLLLSSLSRFANPFIVVMQNKEQLNEYGKYLRNCSQYENDTLGKIARFNSLGFWDKCKVYTLFLGSKMCYIFWMIRKIFDVFHPGHKD